MPCADMANTAAAETAGVFATDSDAPINIEADKMSLFRSGARAELLGNAALAQGPLSLTAREVAVFSHHDPAQAHPHHGGAKRSHYFGKRARGFRRCGGLSGQCRGNDGDGQCARHQHKRHGRDTLTASDLSSICATVPAGFSAQQRASDNDKSGNKKAPKQWKGAHPVETPVGARGAA